MNKEEINFNYKDCYKVQVNLGYDTYFNLCTGEKTNISWGTGFYFVLLIGLILIILLVIGIVKINKDYYL